MKKTVLTLAALFTVLLASAQTDTTSTDRKRAQTDRSATTTQGQTNTQEPRSTAKQKRKSTKNATQATQKDTVTDRNRRSGTNANNNTTPSRSNP
jgi:Ni/Co efflux regulator RcnB